MVLGVQETPGGGACLEFRGISVMQKANVEGGKCGTRLGTRCTIEGYTHLSMFQIYASVPSGVQTSHFLTFAQVYFQRWPESAAPTDTRRE